MISPFKLVLIVSSTISPVESNKVYYLPKDYSIEAERYGVQNSGKNEFMSDILYRIISEELEK